jgi:DNA-binding transcriptional LysR family regulator
MELRHVRYFVAVADSLSFTKGAEKLRIAQPSLTRQIRSLEDELGIPLLDRSKKQIKLTNEGEHFLVGARRLLNYSAELVESLRVLGVKKSAQINIGYLPNPFHRALPVSLALFEKRFPNVSINLFGMPSVEQVRSVTDGKIDLAFVGLLGPVDERGLQSRRIAAYGVVMLLPKNHRAARKKLIHLKDAAQMFFISLSDTCYHGYGQWLNRTCQKAGFKPRILQIADNESILIQAIRSELGIALLPEQIRNVAPENVAIRKVSPAIRIESFAAWKKDNSSGELKSFLEIIEQVSKKML